MSGTPRSPLRSVDLHTHTTASDGTLPPEALFKKALDVGLRVLSITDHDTTAGYESILPLAGAHPEMRLLPGIEMSAEGEVPCHLLGYGIRVADAAFQSHLKDFRARRLQRIESMVKRFQVMGISLSMEQVLAQSAQGTVGRPHIADALMALRVVRSRQEAFDRFLKRDGPAYVSSEGPSAKEVLRIIRTAGGIPVLAHPAYDTSEDLLNQLADWGLMGIEAYYPEHSRGLIERYKELANRYGWVVTGGSDYHGPRTGRPRLACVHVPEEVVGEIDKRLRTNS